MVEIEGNLAGNRPSADLVVLTAARVGYSSRVLVDVIKENHQIAIYLPPVVWANIADLPASVGV